MSEAEAQKDAAVAVDAMIKAEEAVLAQRYEQEIMNPEEALSLGSVSEIVMPSDLRSTLARQMAFCLRHYTPGPMQAVQREFH
jgi:acetyl-CoA carboxylase carboxyltransferase component